MTIYQIRVFILAALTFIGLAASGAEVSAQNFVSFVSKKGVDSNNCVSIAEPCSTIRGAVEKTRKGGSIIVQGPYYAGSTGVSKSLVIVGTGDVVFQAFTLEKKNLDVTVKNVTFNGFGINLSALNMAVVGNVKLSNCLITNYGFPAIRLAGPAGTRVTLEKVEISGSQYGVVVEATDNVALIKDSFIDGSAKSAVEVRGSEASVALINSTLLGSGGLDLSLVSDGKAVSYGGNVIRSGTPTQTIPNN